MHYNKAFKGHQIAMPPPLSDGAVTYADGTEATLDQEAKDIAVFLTWAAEGNLEERHRTGIKAVLFLVIFTLLAYATKRRVWASVHCRRTRSDHDDRRRVAYIRRRFSFGGALLNGAGGLRHHRHRPCAGRR